MKNHAHLRPFTKPHIHIVCTHLNSTNGPIRLSTKNILSDEKWKEKISCGVTSTLPSEYLVFYTNSFLSYMYTMHAAMKKMKTNNHSHLWPFAESQFHFYSLEQYQWSNPFEHQNIFSDGKNCKIILRSYLTLPSEYLVFYPNIHVRKRVAYLDMIKKRFINLCILIER